MVAIKDAQVAHGISRGGWLALPRCAAFLAFDERRLKTYDNPHDGMNNCSGRQQLPQLSATHCCP
eukprot:5781955-Heterocapsa_arctica.AAC.1